MTEVDRSSHESMTAWRDAVATGVRYFGNQTVGAEELELPGNAAGEAASFVGVVGQSGDQMLENVLVAEALE